MRDVVPICQQANAGDAKLPFCSAMRHNNLHKQLKLTFKASIMLLLFSFENIGTHSTSGLAVKLLSGFSLGILIEGHVTLVNRSKEASLTNFGVKMENRGSKQTTLRMKVNPALLNAVVLCSARDKMNSLFG